MNVKDPVCNMDVRDDSKVTSDYRGTTYYFCCKSCKDKFDKNPEKYVT